MAVIPIVSKDQLKPRDVVRDPIAMASGQVVSLDPQGSWQDGSGADRICVEWGWSRYRSDPRVLELVQIVHHCKRCDGRIVPDSLVHGRWHHELAGEYDHFPQP